MEEIVKMILSEIIKAKPFLPSSETLSLIEFKWNDEDLSVWDGGFDINEEIRIKVSELLYPNFEKIDFDYLEILRFIIRQEIENCSEAEFLSTTLHCCYDYLANYKLLEDIPLLLSANDDTSFDANCGLFKDRLFFMGYKNVIDYMKSVSVPDLESIERLEYYAEYYGYKS